MSATQAKTGFGTTQIKLQLAIKKTKINFKGRI